VDFVHVEAGAQGDRARQEEAVNRLLLQSLQTGYAASLLPAYARFVRAASDPQTIQLRKLRQILKDNAGTRFGRRYRFDRIHDLESFRASVPIARFDAFDPWIERIARGERQVLTRQAVRMMERTSGSTSANKLVPFTDGLLREVAASTHAWLFDLMRGLPELRARRSYWSISPAGRSRQSTPGGIPIGMEDDTAYFGPLARWVLSSMMIVPSSLARIENLDRWRWETCRRMMAAEDLGLISVWSPTFLIVLMETIEREYDDLLESLPHGSAERIRRARDANAGVLTGEVIWPRLVLVSCWADGPSKAFRHSIQRWFPRTRMQPKGLLATEGVVSLPLLGVEGSVLAVSGHFLEFLDVEAPSRQPVLAHELREGAAYSPVLTTAGGLYRYHLQDVVRCVGRWRGTACVQFEGRLDCVSDLAGEKLDARVVGKALDQAAAKAPRPWLFAMLAPELGSPPRYRLYVESPGDDAALKAGAVVVEEALLQGAHYAYCRKLGQLGPVEPYRVRDGMRSMEKRRASEGGRVGDLKPTPLDRRTGWGWYFE
jgi:hypothetical protein